MSMCAQDSRICACISLCIDRIRPPVEQNQESADTKKNTDMLNNLAIDKWKNFMTGIAIGVLTQAFLWMILPPQIKLVTLVSLIAVMVLNYGFDVYAKRKKGNYEVLDAAAGTIGGVIGMTLILLLQFGI